MREIDGLRFDQVSSEWWAPVNDWLGLRLADLVASFPELTLSEEAEAWLDGLQKRWVATVDAVNHGGTGWWEVGTGSGEMPAPLRPRAREMGGRVLVPIDAGSAKALSAKSSLTLSPRAQRCTEALEEGETPPGAVLVAERNGAEGLLRLETFWDSAAEDDFASIPGVDGDLTTVADPWILPRLEELLAEHGVVITEAAEEMLQATRGERESSSELVARSAATKAEAMSEVRLGDRLEPFQWAAVRYALSVRRTFLADEQGLGKTVEALAAIEAASAYPAAIVCPASLKLNWEREAGKWLPHRESRVLAGRSAPVPAGEIVILSYEMVEHHRETLARLGLRALALDESHYVKNPNARRTRAVRKLADAVDPDGLRLALSGTPVLNHAGELVSQLRILDQLGSFGSGAEFKRRFAQGDRSLERLHWHLRGHCFMRRLKRDVLPQLPAKRRVIVPVPLSNGSSYRLAERDFVAWLGSQPGDLAELEAKEARALRAQQLAQLSSLQRLAAEGKLAAAVEWIRDFLASGEPLVVFARHVAVQEALLERFPDALHLIGRDTAELREESVGRFQQEDGPQLIICSIGVAGQGVTLTRASNVCFVELEWTPALHDQAEDRVHRIGQERDAVTAWYLIAAGTVDEVVAATIDDKRLHVSAVTEGRATAGESLVDEVLGRLRQT